MAADPERHRRAERTHERCADTHRDAATFWDSRDSERAAAERVKERHDRDGAQIERDRYAREIAALPALRQPS